MLVFREWGQGILIHSSFKSNVLSTYYVHWEFSREQNGHESSPSQSAQRQSLRQSFQSQGTFCQGVERDQDRLASRPLLGAAGLILGGPLGAAENPPRAMPLIEPCLDGGPR